MEVGSPLHYSVAADCGTQKLMTCFKMNSTIILQRTWKKNLGNQFRSLAQKIATSSNCADEKTEPPIPTNKIKDLHSASEQPENGAIYDKKPFRMRCVAGKRYSWCLCGKSKSQPLCDGTHRDIFLKIKLRPVQFVVDETKDYWLCNCKQTSNRPFCDGTHKRTDIQEKIRT